MKKLRNLLLNNLDLVMLSALLTFFLYFKFGNPSERFFEMANIISLYIIFTPVILFLLGGLYMTITNGFDNSDSKCKCCCKCCCCKGEK